MIDWDNISTYTNKIIWADCLSVMRRMPDGCVDLVVTDIPYNEVNKPSNGLRNLDKGIADSAKFNISKLVISLIRICHGSFYVFCGEGQISILRKLFRRHGLTTRHGYWEKDNPSPMNGEHIYLSGFENVMYAKQAGAVFNGFCQKAKWNAPVVVNQMHPTQKPIKIISEMIQMSSNPGDLILDPFFGSGTTGVAAHELGRRWIGIEKELRYVSLARKRLEGVMRQMKLDFKQE